MSRLQISVVVQQVTIIFCNICRPRGVASILSSLSSNLLPVASFAFALRGSTRQVVLA